MEKDCTITSSLLYSRTVPIWDMRQEYEADVIETLESTFGEIENKSSLAEAIMGAARNAAEDCSTDYGLPQRKEQPNDFREVREP